MKKLITCLCFLVLTFPLFSQCNIKIYENNSKSFNISIPIFMSSPIYLGNTHLIKSGAVLSEYNIRQEDDIFSAICGLGPIGLSIGSNIQNTGYAVYGYPLNIYTNLFGFSIRPLQFTFGNKFDISPVFFYEDVSTSFFDTSKNRIGWNYGEYRVEELVESSGYNYKTFGLGVSFSLSVFCIELRGCSESFGIYFGIDFCKAYEKIYNFDF